MLSNAYFLAKFRFDTAENEPAKKLQKIANLYLVLKKKFPTEVVGDAAAAPHRRGGPRLAGARAAAGQGRAAEADADAAQRDPRAPHPPARPRRCAPRGFLSSS